MPVEDKIHQIVKNALIKDGWTITNEPYYFIYKKPKLYADLRAERSDDALRIREIIVVEVKSFRRNSITADFHESVGQYLLYRFALGKLYAEGNLFLAIGVEAHEALQNQNALWEMIAEY
jgi:hypothetical protein